MLEESTGKNQERKFLSFPYLISFYKYLHFAIVPPRLALILARQMLSGQPPAHVCRVAQETLHSGCVHLEGRCDFIDQRSAGRVKVNAQHSNGELRRCLSVFDDALRYHPEIVFTLFCAIWK